MPPRRGATAKRDRLARSAQRVEAQRSSRELQVLDALSGIIEDAADALWREIVHVEEVRNQRAHHCGAPLNCTLTNVACAAINQNMPPHMIEGQKK